MMLEFLGILLEIGPETSNVTTPPAMGGSGKSVVKIRSPTPQEEKDLSEVA